MPIVDKSNFKAKFFFRNADFATICTALFRPKAKISFSRERLETPDGDFFDLDWSRVSSNKLVILCHGLEGSSDNAYISNAALALNDNAYDTCAMNYRGCSGEPNRLLKSYHSGKTEDLDLLISHVVDDYDEIYLLGFSVGGNICLKYLGEKSSALNSKIKSAVTFSVPVSLESCALELAKPRNFIYMKNFLLKLKEKTRIKEKLFPGQISTKNFSKLKNFLDYDENFTAPLNGFKTAMDYWTQSSCQRVLSEIKIPSLIINAIDDPFLGEECYPVKYAEASENLFLEMPEHGGHVGFMTSSLTNDCWQEERILEFFMGVKPWSNCFS